MFDPSTLALTAGFVFIGVVSFVCGLAYNRRPIVIQKSDPYGVDGQLPPKLAYDGALQVMRHAVAEEDRDLQYLRAKAALKVYERDHELNG